MPLSKADQALALEMGRFYDDPLGFVLFAWAWNRQRSMQMVPLPEPWASRYQCKYGPDRWACEQLDLIGAEVKKRGFDGIHAVAPLRMAVASGHGIGKSTFTAWIVCWIMSTRPNARGVVTANTAEQLASKSWAEITKWSKRCITGHWFDITTGKGAMRMTHREAPESWRCDAQTCREENSESFAGLHAADSTPFYIFDEASAVPDSINEVSEGGLTDGEPMKFAFGNPTQNSGWFYEAFHRQRHRWITRQIDSRDVAITNKTTLDEWIADHGIDSDFVKVRVRGMFPSRSVVQFISTEDVDAAVGRHLPAERYQFAPKILTVDPAWEGDDEFTIGLRQGLRFQILKTFRKNDNDVQMATVIAQLEDEHDADAVFVDAGYGTGIVSIGRTWNRDWQLVWFAGASTDPGYLNKRAQMWGGVKSWLKEGGSIDGSDQVLYSDLISPQTVPRADGVIQLESKKDMKRRNLPSPGRGDALALSFAAPVAPKHRSPVSDRARQSDRRDYDPLARLNKR